VTNGERLGTSFTKNEWFGISIKFKELTEEIIQNQSLKIGMITLEDMGEDGIN